MKRWLRAGRDEGCVGSFVGFDSHRVKSDLESFKAFIESRGTETGAWRGNDDETKKTWLWVWRGARQAPDGCDCLVRVSVWRRWLKGQNRHG
jgi:hypothetical protein